MTLLFGSRAAAFFAATAVVASSVTCASAMAADPSSSIPTKRPPGASRATLELDSLTKAHPGLPAAAATRVLEAQRLSSKLQEELASALGERFGGLWIDPETPGRINVRIVGSEGTSEFGNAERTVEALAAKLDLTGTTAVTTGEHSTVAMTALQASLDQGLATANIGAPVTVDAEPDLASGTIQLTLPPTPTQSQRDFVEKALAAYPEVLTTGRKPGALRKFACSGPWCDPPLRGGIGLIYGGHDCTSGFVMRSLSDGVRYLSTAGHCFNGGRTGTWQSAFANVSIHNIGAVHNVTNDFGILKISNPGGWSPGPYIRIQSDQTYRIDSWGASSTGQRMCMAGSYSGSNCGVVTYGLATRNGIPHTYRANYCAQPGDSGGSVFAYGAARGSEIGGYSACDNVYYSASYFSQLNVVPLT